MFISYDLLYHILGYLCDEDLLPIMGVSNMWRRTAMDRIEVLELTSSNMNAVLLLLAECRQVKKLDITFTGDARNQRLNSFIRLPTNATELRCRGAIPEWWLSSVTKRLPNLTVVELIDNDTAAGEFLIGAPLTTIELTNSPATPPPAAPATPPPAAPATPPPAAPATPPPAAPATPPPAAPATPPPAAPATLPPAAPATLPPAAPATPPPAAPATLPPAAPATPPPAAPATAPPAARRTRVRNITIDGVLVEYRTVLNLTINGKSLSWMVNGTP
ncbi:ESX-1 secretion-associated protein EspK-like [Bolinopsis microptera]|uniref:ESX-1 secretion-associated protein EspK-like n=1 Tax=Bolinopsis microptera TaxID=2820187 RepID=UPI003079733F